jgi:hypothetical protein
MFAAQAAEIHRLHHLRRLQAAAVAVSRKVLRQTPTEAMEVPVGQLVPVSVRLEHSEPE